MPLSIEQTNNPFIFEQGARMMCAAEPWITLKKDYNQCLKAFEGPEKEIYAAIEDDKLLGLIILQLTGSFKGYIQTVVVAADARGLGIGTALIRFAEKRIFKISPNVFICVSSFNQKAQQLYFKLGYEQAGLLKNFIADGFDELLLRKTTGTLNEFPPSKAF
jgi:ribosomal protein S18 acetylase RimI-like enzyme